MVLSSHLERWCMSNPPNFISSVHQHVFQCMELQIFFLPCRSTVLPDLLFPSHMLGCSIGLTKCSNQVNGTNYCEAKDTKVNSDIYICHLDSSVTFSKFSSVSQGEIKDRN